MKRLLIGAMFLIPFIYSPAVAATYYVSASTGNDSRSCSTAQNISTPKLTIGRPFNSGGTSCAILPGDILIIRDGTYVEGETEIAASGTAGNPITIRAENKRLAIISSISSCAPNLSIQGSNVTVDGLRFVINAANVYCTPNSASGTAVRCWTGSTGCIVRNIQTDDPSGPNGKIRSHGIKSNHPNTILEDNELAAGLETFDASDGIVRRNHITGGGNWNNAMVIKGGGSDVWVYDNVIDAPTMTGGAGLILGGASAATNPAQECVNCVAWNNVVRVPANVKALNYQGSKDGVFVNNVVLGGSIGMDTAPSSSNSNNRWYNNIILGSGGTCVGGTFGTFTIDYNNFSNCSTPPAQTHPITGNPQFVNATTLDVHVLAGSVAIGTGTIPTVPSFSGANASIVTAYDSTPRVAPWDLGIYDTVTAGPDVTPPSVPGGLTVSP